MEKSIPIPFIEAPLRRAIIKSSNVWGLRSIYTAYYHSAVRALVRAVSRHTATLSIFTRNSYAEGSFIPGQSDIDVAIVIHDNLGPEVIKSYLRNLYKALERLRRRYPMLNQYPVYTRRGFIMAFGLGPLSSETYAWRCEWGEEDFLHRCRDVSDQPAHEPLMRGVQVYLNGFHRSLRAGLNAGQTDSDLSVTRHMKKLERIFGPVTASTNFASNGPLAEITQRALALTTRAVEQFHGQDCLSPWSTVVSDSKHSPGPEFEPSDVPAGVMSIIKLQNSRTSWYVLDRPVHVEALLPGLTMAAPKSGEKHQLVFVTQPLFEFFLRYVNPIFHYRLMLGRAVQGKDCLAQLAPPAKSGVERFFRYEAAKLMEMHTRMGSGQAPARPQVKNRNYRRLRLLHFLRQQEILIGRSDSTALLPASTAEEWLDEIITGVPQIMDAASQSSAVLSVQPLTTEINKC